MDKSIQSNIEHGTPISVHLTNYVQNNEKYDYLKLVSWNVNMQAISAYAPNEWHENNNKWDLVYSQVEKQDADIISFQEISIPFYGINQSDEYHDFHPLIKKYIDSKNWYITNSTASHCGHTLILINKRIEEEYGYDINYDSNIDPKGIFPAVILRKKIVEKQLNIINEHESKYDDNKKVILFAVHLNYGNHGSIARKQAFDRLYKLSKKLNMHKNFVLMGDTNMRDYDEAHILNEYKQKGITSCWELINKQHLKQETFMATFYRNFFQIGKLGTTRYDKIFIADAFKFISFGIFDEAVSMDTPFHFLSDHRAIFAELEIYCAKSTTPELDDWEIGLHKTYEIRANERNQKPIKHEMSARLKKLKMKIETQQNIPISIENDEKIHFHSPTNSYYAKKSDTTINTQLSPKNNNNDMEFGDEDFDLDQNGKSQIRYDEQKGKRQQQQYKYQNHANANNHYNDGNIAHNQQYHSQNNGFSDKILDGIIIIIMVINKITIKIINKIIIRRITITQIKEITDITTLTTNEDKVNMKSIKCKVF